MLHQYKFVLYWWIKSNVMFWQRLITLVAAILFVPTTINTVLQFNDYYKKMKIFKTTKGAQHPLKKPIFQWFFIAIAFLMVFYIFGGFGFIHDYLYPVIQKETKTIKIHDTIYKHDTVYIKGKKEFNNKINNVEKLNEY
jgi:hypothetical protein